MIKSEFKHKTFGEVYDLTQWVKKNPNIEIVSISSMRNGNPIIYYYEKYDVNLKWVKLGNNGYDYKFILTEDKKDNIVGSCYLYFDKINEEKKLLEWQLTLLKIEEKYQGLNYGKTLLKELSNQLINLPFDFLDKQGYKNMLYLIASPMDEKINLEQLIYFYRNSGFESFNLLECAKRFPELDLELNIPMFKII